MTLPGTNVPIPPGEEEKGFALLEPVFAVSGGGLALSQLSEMTGQSGTAIQNWVKRGWVANPVNKKYGELQVARVLMINLLRPTMQLDKIARLLQYINGRVEDRSDDIIPEPQLYTLVSTAILKCQEKGNMDRESLIALIGAQLEGYEGPVPDAKERLGKAMTMILLNAAAAALMQEADSLYQSMIPEESGLPTSA